MYGSTNKSLMLFFSIILRKFAFYITMPNKTTLSLLSLKLQKPKADVIKKNATPFAVQDSNRGLHFYEILRCRRRNLLNVYKKNNYLMFCLKNVILFLAQVFQGKRIETEKGFFFNLR